MKVPQFPKIEDQVARCGRHEWAVNRLIELAKELTPFEVPLDGLNLWYSYKDLSLRQLVMHMNAVLAADTTFPIILDEDGEILDGRHRVMKAMMNGQKTIWAVRFDENPSPCRINED